MSRLVRCAATLLAVGAATVAIAATGSPADAATHHWDGQYRLTRFAASKTGTSLAARQSERDFSDVYTFRTACTGDTCVATVIGGPPAANTTIPRPPRYTWKNGTWSEHFDWQWDCYQGPGVPKVYAPAHSDAHYTPQPDGVMRGSWTTVIDSGPCKGTVTMRVQAVATDPIAQARDALTALGSGSAS